MSENHGTAHPLTLAPALWAQSNDITYQGRLQQAGEPFSGTANLQFVLFDAPSGGGQVGPTETRSGWTRGTGRASGGVSVYR